MCYRPIRNFSTNAQILIYSHFLCFLKHEWGFLSLSPSINCSWSEGACSVSKSWPPGSNKKPLWTQKWRQINDYYFFFPFCLELNLFSVNNIDFVHLEGNRGREREGDFSRCCTEKKHFGRRNEKRQRLQEMVDIFCWIKPLGVTQKPTGKKGNNWIHLGHKNQPNGELKPIIINECFSFIHDHRVCSHDALCLIIKTDETISFCSYTY